MSEVRIPIAAKVLLFISVSAALVVFALGAQDTSNSVDEAFEQFWSAGSPARALRLVETVVETGVTFEEAYQRLARGRQYLPPQTSRRYRNRFQRRPDRNS